MAKYASEHGVDCAHLPVGLDSLNGATEGSSQVSNSRSQPSTFLCEESKIKIDVLGEPVTLTDKLEERSISNAVFVESVTITDALEDLTAFINVLGDLFTTTI